MLLPVALLGAPAGAGAASTSSTAACIRNQHCHRTFVVAHRARGFGAPENSRAAMHLGLAAGVPAIEIDLRASRDGDIFVVHDGSLATADGRMARIETMPTRVVGQIRLPNGEPLPRLDEVYAITRGRAVLVIDFKADLIEQVAAWASARGAFDDVIFFANTGGEISSAARAKTRHPALMTMIRLLDTRITVPSTRWLFGGLPEIFQTDRLGPAGVADLHALGVKVFMNVTPLEHYLQPFKFFALRSVLVPGADFLLTDEPRAMMERVRRARADR